MIFSLFTISSFVFACSPEYPESCSQSQLMQLVQHALSSSDDGEDYFIQPESSSIYGSLDGFRFTRNLALGSRGEEVRYLQKFLNMDPDTQIAYYGYGSPGMETTFFGYSTRNAVMRFQTKYYSDILAPANYRRATGFWGGLSRMKANELIGGSIIINPQPEPGPQGHDGQCGSSNGQSFNSAPTYGLCNSGNATSVTGSGPWNWTCQGIDGGSSSSCSANYGQSNNAPAGVLSVALSYDNPSGTTLVAGQGIAELARYTFTNNSSNEARMTNLQFRRIGVSSDSTLRNVYLFDNSTRISDSTSVSSGRITFNNYNGVIVIPANSTKTISVRADLDTNIWGQTVGISLEYASGNTQVNGQLPINGNTFTIANGSLANVNFTNIQPSSATTSDPTTGMRVWEATLSVNNKNVRFTRLSLKQINSIDSGNITNFRLLIDGNQVAQAYSLDSSGYANFTFDRNMYTGSRNVRVLADITGGSARSIQMALLSNADIDIKDSDYNVSITPTGIPAIAGAISVNVGQVIINPDNANLPTSIAKSGSNILIGKFTFRAVGEDIRVDSLKFGFNTNNALVNSLRNGRVMISGNQAGSTATLLRSGTVYYTNYTFQAGVDTSIEIYADIMEDTSAISGDYVDDIVSGNTIAIRMIPLVANATRKTSYNVINVPSSEVTNSSISISQGNISVTKKSTYGNQATVLPQTNYKIGAWNVYSGNSESINVNNLNFVINPVTGTSFNYSDLTNMYVIYSIDNGQTVTTSIKSTVNPSNDFSVSLTLPANRTMSIDLFANLSGSVTIGDSFKSTLVVSGNGSQSGNSIITTPVDGQVISNNNPSLLITRDPGTPASSLVDDSGTIKTVSYRFESQNDTYTISQLSFDIVDPTVVSKVYLKSGSNVLQERPGASNVVFSDFGNIEVPANSYRVLDIEIVMSNVGTGAGNSGADITTSINIGGCLVRSSNGSLITPTGTPAAGNTIYAYKAYPIINAMSQSSSDDRLTAGDLALLKFSVIPNGGAISWNKMVVSVTKTAANIIADGIRLVDSSSGQTIATLAAGDSDCEDNTLSNCTINLVLPIEEQISTSKTYELRGSISGTLVSSSYITAQVLRSSLSHSAPAPYASVAGTSSNFIWSDDSSLSHSLTTSDWNNDNLINTLPISWTRTVR